MNKGLRCSLLALTIGVLLFGVSATFAQDDRAQDRAAIKAHIESIFQAFINKDNEALRATHAENWLGYLEPGDTMIKGIDAYMQWNRQDPKSPYGMKSFKFREFDMIFKGDAAFVCFVADVESQRPSGPFHRVLEICDFYTKNNGKWIQNGSDTHRHQESVQAELAAPVQLDNQMKKRLLDAREAVWRAYFTNDQAVLAKLVPADTIVLGNSQEQPFVRQPEILQSAKELGQTGMKLRQLEFPQTEMQVYGNTAILYTTYKYELENKQGERHTTTGRATEIFVYRDGAWVNPGWHLAEAKAEAK
jgi:ketosteroid isomerase-like protein